MIAAMVFDAYGTLFDVLSVGSQCERLWPGQGVALSRLWRTKQLEYSWLRSLMGHYADFEALTADALRFACESLGLRIREADVERLLVAYRNLAAFPDAIGALRSVSSRKRAILSNGSPDMLQAVVQNSGLANLFDAVLSVDALRVYKPDPLVYQLAVDTLRVEPSQIGFVSANCWDVCGARSFGFHTFWINRNAAPSERLGAQPDHILSLLTDLVPLLD